MKQLNQILKEYLADHPINFGISDAQTILDFLYGAYCDALESDPPATQALFAQLGKYLEKLPLETNNAMFFIIVKLCTEHERRGFIEGIRWGMQITAETGAGGLCL